jgi:hypothetical protein
VTDPANRRLIILRELLGKPSRTGWSALNGRYVAFLESDRPELDPPGVVSANAVLLALSDTTNFRVADHPAQCRRLL